MSNNAGVDNFGLGLMLQTRQVGVWGLGFGVWGLGFGGLGVWGLGFDFGVLGFGFWVLGFGFWVLSLLFLVCDGALSADQEDDRVVRGRERHLRETVRAPRPSWSDKL